jgi:hypothetical protein
MESHANHEEGTKAFWGELASVDPLWDDWVFGQEVLDWLDKPRPSSFMSELWVIVPRAINAQNLPLLHKIAASIGFAVNALRIHIVDSQERRPLEALGNGQRLVNYRVLGLGVAMPEIPPGSNAKWASAPDLDVLGMDENARKLLWAQIKGWRNEP